MKPKSDINYFRLRSDAGFTLLEILIALGILASVMGTFISHSGVAIGLGYDDRRELQAVRLAQSKLNEVINQIEYDMTRGKFPDEHAESGKFDDPFSEYEWTYKLRKVEIPIQSQSGQAVQIESVVKNVMDQISKSVREIKMTVSWIDPASSTDEERTYELTTHVVQLP